MTEPQNAGVETAPKRNWLLSLDSWAVVIALLAALLVRLGLIPRVPW